MNTLTWLIYFSSVVESLGILFFIGLLCSAFGFLFCLIAKYAEGRKVPIKTVTVILLISAILVTVIPTPKVYWLMVGSEVSEAVVEMPEVSERLEKVLKILDVKLDELAKESTEK